MKEQQVQILQSQMKEKQIEWRDKNLQMEEELEVERENGVALERITNQRDQFQKVIAGLQENLAQFKEA